MATLHHFNILTLKCILTLWIFYVLIEKCLLQPHRDWTHLNLSLIHWRFCFPFSFLGPGEAHPLHLLHHLQLVSHLILQFFYHLQSQTTMCTKHVRKTTSWEMYNFVEYVMIVGVFYCRNVTYISPSNFVCQLEMHTLVNSAHLIPFSYDLFFLFHLFMLKFHSIIPVLNPLLSCL